MSRLNSVVLPAPFGPMSAVIDPALHLEVVDVDRDEAAEGPAHAVGDEDRVGLRDTRRARRATLTGGH